MRAGCRCTLGLCCGATGPCAAATLPPPLTATWSSFAPRTLSATSRTVLMLLVAAARRLAREKSGNEHERIGSACLATPEITRST